MIRRQMTDIIKLSNASNLRGRMKKAILLVVKSKKEALLPFFLESEANIGFLFFRYEGFTSLHNKIHELEYYELVNSQCAGSRFQSVGGWNSSGRSIISLFQVI